jgi:hypothetical protein
MLLVLIHLHHHLQELLKFLWLVVEEEMEATDRDMAAVEVVVQSHILNLFQYLLVLVTQYLLVPLV